MSLPSGFISFCPGLHRRPPAWCVSVLPSDCLHLLPQIQGLNTCFLLSNWMILLSLCSPGFRCCICSVIYFCALSLTLRVSSRRWWSEATPVPLLTLESIKLLLHFLPIAIRSVRLDDVPSGEIHVALWMALWGKRCHKWLGSWKQIGWQAVFHYHLCSLIHGAPWSSLCQR